jgi:hypothetical protein
MRKTFRDPTLTLLIVGGVAAAFAQGSSCFAATSASPLPWDYTLNALQDILIIYIAPATIRLALSGSIVLYALGGRDEQAGRLFGSALGGCVALAVVYLVNYVAF